GPALATWIALFGGAAVLALALVLRRPDLRENYRLGAAATACFVLPVLVHGAWHWSPRVARDPLALSPRLTRELRARVPKGAIVPARIQQRSRVVAAAPISVVAIPVDHVAATVANAPRGRAAAVRRGGRTNAPAVARRYSATWAIRNGRLYR